jgi:hypothetical protein
MPCAGICARLGVPARPPEDAERGRAGPAPRGADRGGIAPVAGDLGLFGHARRLPLPRRPAGMLRGHRVRGKAESGGAGSVRGTS